MAHSQEAQACVGLPRWQLICVVNTEGDAANFQIAQKSFSGHAKPFSKATMETLIWSVFSMNISAEEQIFTGDEEQHVNVVPGNLFVIHF